MESIIVICYLPFLLISVIASSIIFPCWLAGRDLNLLISRRGEQEILQSSLAPKKVEIRDVDYNLCKRLCPPKDNNTQPNLVAVRGELIDLIHYPKYISSGMRQHASGIIYT